MALINCSECGREVSDKATACPGCGAPIAAVASNVTLTPDSHKNATRAAARRGGMGYILIVVGILMAITVGPPVSYIGVIIAVFGLIVFIISRLQ